MEATNIQTATKFYLDEADKLDVPRGTLIRFRAAGYVPHAKQLEFHAKARRADFEDQPNEVGFGGARGGGKTACVFNQIAIDDCPRFDNLKVLFLRESAGSATEAMNDLRLKFLQHIPHEPTRNIIAYPNNSRIILGHFQYEKDINKYLGLEYDIIAIEEATQLSANKVRDIRTCNRSSKGFRPRIYLTTNPGGIGHQWFKSDFIMPMRRGENNGKTFVQSLVTDNKHNNIEYKKTLEDLTGWKRKAWLDGDWDILAGQFFTNWNYDLHTCEPFEIPAHWPVWAALDYGFTHPTTAHLITKFDGTYYIIAEYGRAKTLPTIHASGITQTFERAGVPLKRLRNFSAGADVFQMKGDTQGKTIADQYSALGIRLRSAVMDRVAGASRILQLLGDLENGIAPKLKIFRTCTKLIEQLPSMMHDPHRPEDVLKIDVDENGEGGDDYYDSFRYGIMSEGGVGVFI